jgi:hypothetical protein
VTVPVDPSTLTSAPSGIRLVASVTLTTHGMPSSRLTMIAWLTTAPTLTTTATAGTNNGVHAGSVIGAISTSPGSSANGSPGCSTTRARPSATPGAPGTPASTSPGAATAAETASLRCHDDTGGATPSMMNGGSYSHNSRYCSSRAVTRGRKPSGPATNASSSSSSSMHTWLVV